MADLAAIFNMALSNAGQNATVATPEESSSNAATLRRFYDLSRDVVLQAAPWQFATRIIAPAAHAGAPPYPWSFAYEQPADCVFVQGLLQEGAPPVPYEIGGATAADGTDKTLILTDLPAAWLRYTRRVEDPARYPAYFVVALSWHLAWSISPVLSLSRDWRQEAWQFYLRKLDEAMIADARQIQRAERDGDLLDARA